MESCYRIHVCRDHLSDNHIPLLEKVLHQFLGTESESFNRAFNQDGLLTFESCVSVDEMQECLTTLEIQGFQVRAEKLAIEHIELEEPVAISGLDNPNGARALSDSDVSFLLANKPKGLSRLIPYQGWVAFGCSFIVASIYLLMVYITVNE
ncbi:MAG: hypothetical protein MI867_07130 [Pseudomonadales bacterium]|nr:hypothetical protein [Pseudomonadales bacterium]